MRTYHRFASFVDVSTLNDNLLWMHPEYFDIGDKAWVHVKMTTLFANAADDRAILYGLCGNPSPEAMHIVAAHFAMHPPLSLDTVWLTDTRLSANVSAEAGAILAAHPALISWGIMSANPAPHAIRLLEAHPEKINWSLLSHNSSPTAVKWLLADPYKICVNGLCQNRSPTIIQLLLTHQPNHDNWSGMSCNPAAMPIITAFPNYIHWSGICCNPSDEAMAMLSANLEEINWARLSSNSSPYAIALLLANPDKIIWQNMASNPRIFELDYPKMEAQMAPLRADLLRNRMHPRYLHKAQHDWLLFS